MRLAIALALLAGNLLMNAPAADHRLILGAVGYTKQETQQRERDANHRLVGVRLFRRWDDPLFGADQGWAKRTGHVVFLSIKTRHSNGAPVPWRDIAAAQPGTRLQADMLRQAKQLKRFGATVYVVFNHEPDAGSSRPMGGPGDFIAAWRHLVDTYRAAGVRNARYVWTLTGTAFNTSARANAYYPGDAYVDDIAADTYNWSTCHSPSGTWQSPAELLDPQRRFGLRHRGKGLMLLEWGSVEDPARPGRKAQWIQQMAQLLTTPAYRQYRAALAWDDRFTGPSGACNFDTRTSPGALTAWRTMAANPAFAAQSPCDIGDCAAAHPQLRRHRNLHLPLIALLSALAVAAALFVAIRRRDPRFGR
jgi:hypothetical protein